MSESAAHTVPRFASEPYPTGRTLSGREVVVCYCGGGDVHEWRPNGGGARILACYTEAPVRKPDDDGLRQHRSKP